MAAVGAVEGGTGGVAQAERQTLNVIPHALVAG